MNILTERDVHELLARTASKWIVTVHGLDTGYDFTQHEQVFSAAPWLTSLVDPFEPLVDGHCAVLFDAEDEARQFYSTLPTDDNPVGEVLFFAQLFSPVDGLVSEST